MERKKREFTFFWEASPEKAENIDFQVPKLTFQKIKHIPVRVSQTEGEVIVKAEFPGLRKNELSLSVAESYFEIEIAKKYASTGKTAKAFVQERKADILRRGFALPANVDPDKTDARLDNGVLTVIISKNPKEQKKKRRIDIK